MHDAPPAPQWLGSSCVTEMQALAAEQHPEQLDALQPDPATHAPFEQLGVLPLHVLHEAPPTPQYRLVTPV
jgi:hypothetical protein